MTKQKLLLLLVLYLFSAGVTYAATTTLSTSPTTTVVDKGPQTTTEDPTDSEGKLLAISPQEAKDQACPINGKMFTNSEKTAWEKRRPLAVMIENSPDARPQSGLSKADIVFEALAEGGVTRFMAVFYCGVQAEDTQLAPIRSARTYFVDWASGFNLPMYVHVGGANADGPTDALQQISDYGWNGQNDMNQFSIGFPTFVRDDSRLDRPVATEHTMVTTTEKLWAVATKRGWTNITPTRKVGKTTTGGKDWKEGFTPWPVAEDAPSASPTAAKVSFEFWDGFELFGVKWDYDKATNSYKRTLANEPHIDLNTKQQIAVKNAVVLLTTEEGPINAEKHMLYKTTGTGDALIFNNGNVTKAKWAKKDRESQLTFNDDKGKPLSLVRGETWISVVDKTTKVTY